MAIHEDIRQEGEKSWSAMPCSSVVSDCRRSVDGRLDGGKRDFPCPPGRAPGGFLLENLGYTFGFIIVIMARQQLFTENTVTAVCR
jgi:hypothetical protein